MTVAFPAVFVCERGVSGGRRGWRCADGGTDLVRRAWRARVRTVRVRGRASLAILLARARKRQTAGTGS